MEKLKRVQYLACNSVE